MIDEVKIKGFKGIQYLESNQKRLNLITGRNNTGKTSFLEALNLAYNPAKVMNYQNNLDKLINRKSDSAKIEVDDPENMRNFRMLREIEEEDFELFNKAAAKILLRYRVRYYGKHSGSIEKEEVVDAINDSLSKYDDSSIPSSDGSISVEFNGQRNVFYKWEEEHSEFLMEEIDNIVDNIIGEENSETSKQKDLRDNVKESNDYQEDLKGRRITERREKLKEMFRNQVESRRGFVSIYQPPNVQFDKVEFIKDLTTRPDRKEDVENRATRVSEIEKTINELNLAEDLVDLNLTENLVFEDDGKYEVPYEFMGDGFKAIVNLLWHLEDDQTEILLIEEPGVHMHPGYVSKIVDFLIEYVEKDKRVQFFITTHNNDFIRSLFSEELDEDKQEFLQKNFNLLQMNDMGAKVFDYQTSKRNLKKQLTDLRGI